MNPVQKAINKKIPKEGSIENLIESRSGWIPGMKQKFDQALMKKDQVGVLRLLSKVPKEYKQRFHKNIKEIINF